MHFASRPSPSLQSFLKKHANFPHAMSPFGSPATGAHLPPPPAHAPPPPHKTKFRPPSRFPPAPPSKTPLPHPPPPRNPRLGKFPFISTLQQRLRLRQQPIGRRFLLLPLSRHR